MAKQRHLGDNGWRKALCLDLAHADSAEEVTGILAARDLLDDDALWRDLGDEENNAGIVGAQQSTGEAALVEKITNSLDAVLMRGVLARGIDPTSPQAPRTTPDAVDLVLDDEGRYRDARGHLTEGGYDVGVWVTQRNSELESHPSVIVADGGEGQTPARMPSTVLSIAKSNKAEVPFVQGRFNMGATGVLRFCAEGYQVIVSKRAPELQDEDDETSVLWGFTVIRRVMREGLRLPKYEYLVSPSREVMTISADGLPVLPRRTARDGTTEYRRMRHGMFCKMVEMDGVGSLTGVAHDRFAKMVSSRLPTFPISIPVEDHRPRKLYYKNRSKKRDRGFIRPLVRRLEGRQGTIISGPHVVTVGDGERAMVTSYVLPVSARAKASTGADAVGSMAKRYDAILFCDNGQTHSALRSSTYSHKDVGLDYISDCAITIVDVTSMSTMTRAQLFMASRNGAASTREYRELERQVLVCLRKDEMLRAEANRRKREGAATSKGVVDSIAKSLRKFGGLRALLSGRRVDLAAFEAAAGNSRAAEFVGLEHPTFVRSVSPTSGQGTITAVVGKTATIRLETDAANGWLTEGSGRVTVYRGFAEDNHRLESDVLHHTVSLRDGRLSVHASLPDSARVGSWARLSLVARDADTEAAWLFSYSVEVLPSREHEPVRAPGTGAKRRTGSSGRRGGRSLAGNMPELVSVTREQWSRYDLDADKAVRLMGSEAEGYQVIVNMDQQYFLSQCHAGGATMERTKLMQERWSRAVYMAALSGFARASRMEEVDDVNGYVADSVNCVCDAMPYVFEGCDVG